MHEQFDLTGRIALVTGGNSGLGRGIATGLAEAGASVVIAARNERRIKAVVDAIRAAGGTADGVFCDVGELEQVNATVAGVVEQHGALDILVPAAGIVTAAAPEQMSDEAWNSVVDTNLSAVFRLCRAAHPHLAASRHGKIITLGSQGARFGVAQAVSYAASKGGIAQLTRSLAVAWARDGIQVNALMPGWFWTRMTAGYRSKAMASEVDRIVARTPAGRFGKPEDIAGAAVFLASDASSFITGQLICVDGGYSAG